MSKPKDEDIPVVVTKMYDLSLWMLQKTEKFPRSYKFSLGERLAGFSLDLQVALVEAAYATKKDSLLDFASRRVNGMRYLLRMAKDLKLLTVDSYGFAAERLDEIGRMVGGWRKTAGGRA